MTDKDIYWTMNAQCVKAITRGGQSCRNVALEATNPDSPFGHAYPEIQTEFPDSPTDQQLQVNFRTYPSFMENVFEKKNFPVKPLGHKTMNDTPKQVYPISFICTQESWTDMLKSLYAYEMVVSKISSLEEVYTCLYDACATCLTGSSGCGGYCHQNPRQKETAADLRSHYQERDRSPSIRYPEI